MFHWPNVKEKRITEMVKWASRTEVHGAHGKSVFIKCVDHTLIMGFGRMNRQMTKDSPKWHTD